MRPSRGCLDSGRVGRAALRLQAPHLGIAPEVAPTIPAVHLEAKEPRQQGVIIHKVCRWESVDPYAQAVIGHADTDWQPILTRYMRMFITNSSDLGRTKGSAKRDLIVSNVYEIIIWILIVIIVS